VVSGTSPGVETAVVVASPAAADVAAEVGVGAGSTESADESSVQADNTSAPQTSAPKNLDLEFNTIHLFFVLFGPSQTERRGGPRGEVAQHRTASATKKRS